MWGVLDLSFQTWLHKHVWFAFSCEKLWRYWPYLCLKSTVHPVCVFVVLLSSLVIEALYTRFVTEHFPGKGQFAFLLTWHLQYRSVFCWGYICLWWSLRTFWLCLVKILFILFVVLYDNLIVFLLQILCNSWNSFHSSPWIVLIFPFFIIDILGFRFPHWHYCADFAFLHQWTHFRVPHGLCLFSLSSSLTSYWVPSWTILYLFCLHFFWRGWEKWVCMTNRMCCANHSIQGMFCETTVFQNILWNHSIKFVHNTDHHFS